MNLKKIEFVGKLDALEDCLDFPDRNKFTETYQESDIVFPDLVFTLSQKYLTILLHYMDFHYSKH